MDATEAGKRYAAATKRYNHVSGNYWDGFDKWVADHGEWDPERRRATWGVEKGRDATLRLFDARALVENARADLEAVMAAQVQSVTESASRTASANETTARAYDVLAPKGS